MNGYKYFKGNDICMLDQNSKLPKHYLLVVQLLIATLFLLFVLFPALAFSEMTESKETIKLASLNEQGEAVEQIVTLSNSGVMAASLNGLATSTNYDVKEKQTKFIVEFMADPLFVHKNNLSSGGVTLNSADLNSYREQLHVTQSLFKTELTALDAKAIITYEFTNTFNGVAIESDNLSIETLEKLTYVKRVYPDLEVKAILDQSVPLIDADDIWNTYGIDGSGMRIAIIDTGIDYTHPDLGSAWGVRVKGGYDFVNDDADPMDDHGHGTHCAGIAAGNGVIKGVAPKADLYAYKVLSASGSGSFSTVIAGIERACDPDQNINTDDAVDVISLSLGGSGDPDDPVCQAVDNATDSGVVCVVAAGNSGGPSYRIGSPGLARKAITVAASDKSDAIAYFSSRGPSNVTHDIKPDITAPGVSIKSCLPGNTYDSWSGTSMATPHMAGAAALIKQYKPSLSPKEIKSILMTSAKDIGEEVYVQGAGRVSMLDAFAIKSLVTPSSISLGLDDLSESTWLKIGKLSIKNVGTTSQLYNLSVEGGLPNGVTVSFSDDSFMLVSGNTIEVTYTISVDNTVVPNPDNTFKSYEGCIVIQSTKNIQKVPFSFIKSPMLKLTFDANPWIVNVYDHTKQKVVASTYNPGTDYSALVPEGTYDVFVYFSSQGAWVLKENVVVPSNGAALNLLTTDATHLVSLMSQDKNGNNLSFAGGGSLVFTHKTSGLGTILSGGIPSVLYVSDISSNYSFHWGFKNNPDYQEGDLYYIAYSITDGVSDNVSIHYTASDLVSKEMQLKLNPAVSETFIYPENCVVFENFSMCSKSNYSDLHLTNVQPFQWYSTPIDSKSCIRFKLSVWKKDYFSDGNYQDQFYETAYLRTKDSSTLEGYLWGYSNPVFRFNGDSFKIGCAPPVPTLKSNTPSSSNTEIRLDGLFGHYERFLLSQYGDFKPYTDLSYSLYKNGEFVRTSVFPKAGKVGTGAYYWESIAVDGEGLYKLEIPYNYFWTKGIQGNAKITLECDTSQSDCNPPYFTRFQMTSDGVPSDEGSNEQQNKLTVEVDDDIALDTVTLFAKRGTGDWQVLEPIASNGLYVVDLSVNLGMASQLIDIKVEALDNSGNKMIYEVSPAFYLPAQEAYLDVPVLDEIVVADGAYTLNWNDILGAAIYEVRESLDDGFATVTRTFQSVGSGITLNPLSSDTIYYYQVRACTAIGGNTSSWSNAKTFVPAPVLANITEIINDEKVKLSWTEIGGAEAYQIEEAEINDFSVIARTFLVEGATEIIVTPAEYNKEYFYRVKAWTRKP